MSGGTGYNSNLRKKARGVNVGPRRGGSRVPDKSVLQDGVYTNERFLHMVASLVGCTAQVKVKNGNVYEGILRTSSPKFEVVLERAHLVEKSSDGKIDASFVPSHDQIIQSIIFNRPDIVLITFTDVNLDYAVVDGFTDGAISSKCNGQVREKELQPWVSDISAEDDGLEGIEDSKVECQLDNEKGWDPMEMFATNSKKFNIKSDYDPSLSQYTTPLHKSDTPEFRLREEKAHLLAMEIEQGIDHSSRAALENGDNEELTFSAVMRPSSSSDSSPMPNAVQGNASPSNLPSSGGNGKYVAPHMRNSQSYATVSQPQHIPPAQRPQNLIQSTSSPVTAAQTTASALAAGAPPAAGVTAVPVSAVAVAGKSQIETVTDGAENRINGNFERVDKAVVDLASSSSLHGQQQQLVNEPRDKRETVFSSQQQHTPKSIIPKGPGNLHDDVKQLKKFHSDFKLSESSSPVTTSGTSVSVSDNVSTASQPVIVMSTSHPSADHAHQLAVVSQSLQPPQRQPTPVDQQESSTDVLKKSLLNPMAKEFNPIAKAAPPRVVPSTTPPRPLSVPPSPVSNYPTPVAASQMPAGPPPAMYPQHVYIPVQQQQQQGPRYTAGPQQNKRVTVSARGTGELGQTPQATIMTGAPLITAQPMMQMGQPNMFQQHLIPVAPASGYAPFQLMMAHHRPTVLQMGQHDPGSMNSGLPQFVATSSQPGSVYLSQPVVHLSHPSMQAHGASTPGAPMTSQQAQSTGSSSGGPHPPASGHQTPTPSQLQQYSIQQVMPPSASGGTPQSGPPHGAAAYHPMSQQHQQAVLSHQMVMQQQNVGSAQSGPSPQSPQVAYTTGPVPMHYATHHQGMMAYVPASQSAQMQQQQHAISVSLSQQSSAPGTSTVQMSSVQHPPPQAHMMMTQQQQQQQQQGAASQHAMHPQSVPPMPTGSGMAPQMILSGQPPQPGGPAGAGQPGAHQYVQAHPMQGAMMTQGHISMQQTPQHLMFAVPHPMHQGPPQMQNFQHGGPQQ